MLNTERVKIKDCMKKKGFEGQFKRVLSLFLSAVLFFAFSACKTKEEALQDESTENNINLVQPSDLPQTVADEFNPSEITGYYLKECEVKPEDDYPLLAIRMELLYENDRLYILFTHIYENNEDSVMVYDVEAKISDESVSAEYNGDYVQLKLLSDGKTAEVDITTFEGMTSYLSGRYERIELKEEYTPDSIPEAVNDPATPDGALDAALARAVRKQLGLPEDALLTKEILSEVTELEISAKEAVSLNGIEYFTNLRKIVVWTSYVKDISPLANISTLENIYFYEACIDSIPDFSKCKNLKRLTLFHCAIKDLTPVTKIESLEYLDLRGNRITSIATLKEINKDTIKIIDINENPITDWETIAGEDKLIEAIYQDYDITLEVLNKAREVVNDTITDDMSELQKEAAIYKKIVEMADYNVSKSAPDTKMPDGYAVLMNGGGVCSDYAKAVSLLMTLAGFECFEVYSNNHAWNVILIDGEYYEIDATYDDTSEPMKWNYFNLSRAKMDAESDHHIKCLAYPVTNRSMMKLEYLKN